MARPCAVLWPLLAAGIDVGVRLDESSLESLPRRAAAVEVPSSGVLTAIHDQLDGLGTLLEAPHAHGHRNQVLPWEQDLGMLGPVAAAVTESALGPVATFLEVEELDKRRAERHGAGRRGPDDEYEQAQAAKKKKAKALGKDDDGDDPNVGFSTSKKLSVNKDKSLFDRLTDPTTIGFVAVGGFAAIIILSAGCWVCCGSFFQKSGPKQGKHGPGGGPPGQQQMGYDPYGQQQMQQGYDPYGQQGYGYDQGYGQPDPYAQQQQGYGYGY